MPKCEHKAKYYVNAQSGGRVECDSVFCADCGETLYDRKREGAGLNKAQRQVLKNTLDAIRNFSTSNNFCNQPEERQQELSKKVEQICSDRQGARDKLSRPELAAIVCELADKIKSMFDFKNNGYGQAGDGLHNFRASAARMYGRATPANMLKVLQVLQDKHLVALNNKGLDLEDFEERYIDVAAYSLIAVGIAREAGSDRTVK